MYTKAFKLTREHKMKTTAVISLYVIAHSTAFIWKAPTLSRQHYVTAGVTEIKSARLTERSDPGSTEQSHISTLNVYNLPAVGTTLLALDLGFIAITGESGAGKSLLANSLSLAAGGKALKMGEGYKGDTARIELAIQLHEPQLSAVGDILERNDISTLDMGRRLEVSREVSLSAAPKGRRNKNNGGMINGVSVGLNVLKEVVSPLIRTIDADAVDVFSRADTRRKMVDRLLSSRELSYVDEVRRCVGELRDAEAVLQRLETQEQAAERRRSVHGGTEDTEPLLEHWVDELDQFEADQNVFVDTVTEAVREFTEQYGEEALGSSGADLLNSIDESESMRNQGGILSDSRLPLTWEVLQATLKCVRAGTIARERLETAQELLNKGGALQNALVQVRGLLLEADAEGAPCLSLTSAPTSALETAHDRLNHVEAFLKAVTVATHAAHASLVDPLVSLEVLEIEEAKWKQLSRKHSTQPNKLHETHKSLRKELDGLSESSNALPAARDDVDMWREEAEGYAGALHAARLAAGTRLEALVNPALKDLGMGDKKFYVKVEDGGILTSHGVDRVQLYLGGLDDAVGSMLPIDTGTSSGEKSRLLLLLESSLPPPPEAVAPCVVLYDEIDAHVGGRTAVAVGKLLAKQGQRCQVLVVTHTATVAAQSTQHIVVERHQTSQTYNDQTSITRIVTGKDRENELARMAAGGMGGTEADSLARAMLAASSAIEI